MLSKKAKVSIVDSPVAEKLAQTQEIVWDQVVMELSSHLDVLH